MKPRVSDLKVEQLALGELPPDEAARVRGALGVDADARLEALANEDAEIRSRLPAARVAAEVKRRMAAHDRALERRPSIVGWWIPALGLAAALVIAWVWVGRDPPDDRTDTIARNEVVVGDADGATDGAGGREVVYVKGDARLWIERQGAHEHTRLADGDPVREGERLQVHYDAANRREGVIVSIDGRGVATLHFPEEAASPPTLQSGGAVALDHSYELDDAPRFERFFFVTARPGHSVNVPEVLAAARALAKSETADTAPLELPAGLEQTSIVLTKR